MKYLHTMIRITNIEKSLDFFCKGLGLKETRRKENEKGSIEAGKAADFVILDRDIMFIPDEEILKTKVEATYINGEKVYGTDKKLQPQKEVKH